MTLSYVIEAPKKRAGSARHVQIAEAVASDIQRGRLAPRERLPGARKLAAMLGVHRNTVSAAIQELAAQGWVDVEPARGVFVRELSYAERAPVRTRRLPSAREAPAKAGFTVPELSLPKPARAIPKDVLLLTGGVPDPRLIPRETLARAYRRALRKRGSEILDYAGAFGDLRLRHALSLMLAKSRGVAVHEENVIVTRGSQQAIWLAAASLLAPGDRIGVEAFGYPPAWDAFRATGARLVPLALDHEGVRVESLVSALAEGPLRAIYLTPHHQFPTMVALSAPRRLELLELARKHRFAILEDDYSHEFHYEGRPRLPMASVDRHGQVVYLGSLSKVLAPGLRVGYAVAPPPLIERMAELRTYMDRQGDAVGEAAVAELFEDGEVARHARKMRLAYLSRRDALAAALERHLGERISFDLPPGGMALWVRLHEGDPEAWVSRAKERGVWFRAGSELHVRARSVPYVRMGYTRLNERELERAVREAARAWK